MFHQKPLTLAIGFISTIWICAHTSTASAAPVKVDINANVKHSVNGVSNFGRERRITIHANSIENDFLGEKEKLDYLMELGVYFGRDTGLSMYYFGQTVGDPSKSTPAGQGEPFPYGYADVHDSESLKRGADQYYEGLATKYIDAQEYFNRDTAMIMGSQPRPAFPNWSSYSWFGGGLTSDTPWRPRTMQQTADWTAEFLEEFFLRREGDPNVPQMPQYWEVVNEPDMQMNTTGPEGHVSTWEELFRYHNVVADTIRAKLGNKAPKIGGMTWGLHDFQRGDATAFGAPRLQGDTLLSAFYNDDAGSQQIKNTVSNGIFAESDTMSDPNTSRDWYQWDVIWKGFLDTAGKNMDFYSIHIYDWPLWQTTGGNIRTGTHTEGVMDLLEWYDMKILGQRNEVIVSEYGSVTGKYQEEGTTIDRIRMRWEKLKPFSQMMMQFMERPDYITSSLPFITVKAEWGDLGLTQPYSQTLLDRDYSTCDIEGEGEGQRYTNCTWNFNPAIHWYELWRDVEGTRVDTYSTDRDIQVDAYVNNDNGEHHMYVIINSIEQIDTEVDLSFAGISGNPISNITMRHLYLDEAIDADNNVGNGSGKPIMAEATLATLPDSLVVAADSTIILDIEYANNLGTPLTNEEKKYPAEPLSNVSPYRVSVPATITAQVNNVPKPANGEAQVRITGAFFINGQLETDSSDSRVFLQVNGNNVEFNTDWRGEEKGQNRQMATLEIPFPAEYLANNGNNTISFSTLANGQVAAVALQVWDMDTQIQRSVEGDCSPCTGVSNFNIAQGSVNLKVTSSVALNTQITPASASNKRINWTSSNPSVASVDQNGIVTGTGVGTATITGVAADGGSNDQTTIRVTQLNPTSVSIVGVPPVLYVGGEKQLSAAVRPIHAPNRQVTWSSSNPGVATVSDTGVVSGVGSGSTTITVRTVDGGLIASTTLNVDTLGVTGFSISPNSTLLPVGDTFQLSTTFEPANASNQSITWTSSNNSIATVINGVITGVSSGRVTITGRANDSGITDSSTIEVVNASATPVFIEAENFDDTGGPFAGFAIDTAKGHINDNQTGDWGEYSVTFPSAGTYQFILDAGVPVAGVGVAISLNGQEVARGGLAATGDWDVIERMVVTNNVPVASAGTYTVRITSTGPAGQWVWNADKLGFRQLTGNIIVSSSSQSSTPVSSTPVSSSSVSSDPVSSSSSSIASSSSVPQSSSVASSAQSSVPAGNLTRVELENFINTGKDGTPVGADTFAGFNAAGPIINFNTTGDWADYTLTIPQSGRYKIDIHAASPTTGDIGVRLMLNGQEIASTGLSSTGDWGNFETFEIDDSVNLDAGSYTLRVQSQGNAAWQWNGNYVDFTLLEQTSSSQSSSSPASSNVTVELESFDDTGKAGGPIGGDTVIGFNATNNGINFNTRGDWADYTVTFANNGTYRAIIEAGSPMTGDIGVVLMLNNQEIASSSLSTTGDWDNYVPFEVGSNISINAGTYTLRVQSQGNEIWQWNADKIRFEQ